jgi:hypothetical protein
MRGPRVHYLIPGVVETLAQGILSPRSHLVVVQQDNRLNQPS